MTKYLSIEKIWMVAEVSQTTFLLTALVMWVFVIIFNVTVRSTSIMCTGIMKLNNAEAEDVKQEIMHLLTSHLIFLYGSQTTFVTFDLNSRGSND